MFSSLFDAYSAPAGLMEERTAPERMPCRFMQVYDTPDFALLFRYFELLKSRTTRILLIALLYGWLHYC